MTERKLIGHEELDNKVVNYYVHQDSSDLFIAGAQLLFDNCDILPIERGVGKVAEFVLSQANDEIVGVKAKIISSLSQQLIKIDCENVAIDQPTLHYKFDSLTFFWGDFSTQSLITIRPHDPLQDRGPFDTDIIQRAVEAFCDEPVLELAR